MLGKRKGLASVLAVLLSLLVVSPQFMVALLTARAQVATPALISVENTTCLKTLSEVNETVSVQQCVTSETWTNGTRLDISEHLVNSTFDLCVNCTTWLDSTTTANATSNNATINAETSTFGTNDEPGLYPYWRQRNDTDGLFFLLKGSNSTCFVSYDHDDNYDSRGYYSCNWTYPFELQGQTKTHIHLPVQFLDNWRNGEIETALVMGTCIAGYKLVENYGGADVFDNPTNAALETSVPAAVGIVLGTSWGEAAAVLVLLADIIYSIIQATWQSATTAWWIDHTVREGWPGALDGWAWRGPLDEEFCCLAWDPYFWIPMTIYNWHRVYFFNQTWGSEGVFGNPQLYAIDLGFDHQTHSPIGPKGVEVQ